MRVRRDRSLTWITRASTLLLSGALAGLAAWAAPARAEAPVPLTAAVLPSARAVQVGATATAFVTVINAGSTAALDVGMTLGTPIPATLTFQTTDPHTNAPTGAPNTAVTIAAGQKQTFVIAITPSQAFPTTEVTLAFSGRNTAPVTPLSGVNTLLLSASSVPGPDIVATSATESGDGIVTIDGPGETAALAVATWNVGTAGTITVSADTGGAALPLGLALCQTHPVTGQCISPLGPSVTLFIGGGESPTFAVVATATAEIPIEPAAHRVFIRLKDVNGATRGATSTAVQTPTCPAGSTARLKLANQCDDGVWAVMTPPGTPAQVHVAAQWDWMAPYLAQRNFINTGATGTILTTAPSVLAMSTNPGPNPALAKGMTIRVTGAGPAGGDLTTKILTVSGATVTLVDSASTPVANATVWYDTGQGAFAVASGTSKFVCVPDKGAPSGNFRFFMGCPSLGNDTDPFGPNGCVIGSGVGDLSNVNTLFEPSFGCKPPLSGSACAFNPADTAAQGYPNCQSDPNATNCGPLTATDYYDISAVDGYTLPMRVDAAGQSCSAPSKDASMLDLASCPSENAGTLYSDNATRQAVIAGGVSLLTTTSQGGTTYLQACAAPHAWFETTSLGFPVNPTRTTAACSNGTCNAVSYYAGEGCDTGACAPCDPSDMSCSITACTSCPGGSGPQQKVGPLGTGQLAIQNTNYVQSVRALGYRGYTWQFDDGVGAQTCNAGAKLKVTLCPAGASRKPYQSNTLWTFSPATGTCSTDGTAGTPNGTTTFGSLFACQTANMQYTCANLTASDPFGLPIAIWAADPAATLNPTRASRTYASFTAKQKLHCEQVTVATQGIPSDGQIDVTNCTYYFKDKTVHGKDKLKLCPAP